VKLFIFKIIRILILLCVLVPFANATITQDDIIMYYDFNDASIINENITDRVNNWDGIIQESIVTSQNGKIDKAFYFNGSQTQQAFINISGNPLFNSTQGSFYTWIKIGNVPESDPDNRYWMYIMVNQKGYDYSIAGHDGDFSCTVFWEFYLYFIDEPQWTSFQTYSSPTICGAKTLGVRRSKVTSNPNNFLTDDNFHLWIVTWDNQVIAQYWDGELMGVVENSGNIVFSEFLNDTNTHVGNFYTNVYNSFNGYIDELGLFNRALTSEEVIGAYNNGLGKSFNELLVRSEEAEYSTKITIYANNNTITSSFLKSGYSSSSTSNVINWLNLIWGEI